MIDMDNRLRVARGIAKTETEASVEVFETLQRCGHPDAPPPTISDASGRGFVYREKSGIVLPGHWRGAVRHPKPVKA